MLSLYFLASPAMAVEVVYHAIPQAQVIGKARLTFAFWDVYDATLYAPAGQWNPNQPFALSLRYLRNLNGADIADRSVKEMRGQGFTDAKKLADWHAQMKKIFPDVQEGSVISAVFIPQKKTIFYLAEQQIGMVEDAAFTQHFSNIWLGEKTSEPAMRRKLLGLS